MTRALSGFIRNFLSCLMVAGVFVAASASAQVGTFQFVIGDVRVRNAAGVERPAVQGATVNERDTIVSGASGEAQLLMVDNAFVAIRRNTELRIDQYNYKGRNDGSESGVLHLVKGTFRALTGLIVRSNKQNFTMKTAVSTIGIRGTGNITHHDQGANVTTNHTVTGSHNVTSVDPATGSQIGVTVVTSPGVTVQVTRGQPPRQIPTPTFILAESSRDPKEKKAEPEKKEKEAPRLASSQRAETQTRETEDQPRTEPTPQPQPPAVPTPVVEVPQPPKPSLFELQATLASIQQQLLVLQSDLAAVNTALSTVVSATQSAATSAANAATATAAKTPVDLTTVSSTVNLAVTVATFFPTDTKIQASKTTAQTQLTTAVNAAGAGNTSSTLAVAQSTASTSSLNAAAQVPLVQAAYTPAQQAYLAAQTTAAALDAAIQAQDATLAQQLLDQLRPQVATAQQLQQTASSYLASAQKEATTAATALTTATGAVSTASTSATAATTAANDAIVLAQANLKAPIDGTYSLAQTAYNNISTPTTGLVALTQAAATSATNSSSSASLLSAVDLAALDAKIALAQSLKPFAPANQQATIQSQIDAALAARTTAFNAAGLGNTSSTLATAQTSATGASGTASAQVKLAQNAAAAALTAYNLAQTIYNNAVTALNNNDIATATQLLSDLAVQKDIVVAKEAEAAAALKAAQDAATTAANALNTAKNAVSTAGTTVASTTTTIDTTIASLLTNVQAVADATKTTRDQISTINTALGTASGTTAQQAFDAASTAYGNSTTAGTAQGDAATIAGITAINTTTASNNLASVTTAANKAQNQVGSATNVNTANSTATGVTFSGSSTGNFRDAQAAAALTAMNAANNLINAATTGYLAVATAKNTEAGTQSTTLTGAKASALTQSGSATTAFSTATDSASNTFSALTTAAQVDAGLTNANQTVANLLSLANTAATAAQNYATSAQTNPSDATLAAAELTKAQAYLTLAQQIQKVILQRDAVVTAQGQLASLLTSATDAKSLGDAAVAATTTALTNTTTQAPTVAQQAVIAQYRNPLVASASRVTSVGVGANRIAAGSNERFKNSTVNKGNTNYVIGPTLAGFTNNLDTTRSLVESKVTDKIELDKGGTVSTPPGTLLGTDMTIAGETALDYFVAANNTAGSENYVELGRVTGGQIKSGTTVVMDLGTGAGARSYHWLIGYEPPAGYTAATKLTGTTSYTMIPGGRTLPTDASGNVGALNSATLSVDFTAQAVTAGVNVTIANKTLDATTGAAPVQLGPGTAQFSGPFQTVTCTTGTGCSGTYKGDLAGSLTGQKADGGGFVYSLFPTTAAGSAYTDLILGAVAFQAATPPELIPQPPANIATAYHYGSGNSSVVSFQANSISYTLDAGNNLTQVAEDPMEGSSAQAISNASNPVQGTPVTTPSGDITFGRWQGGSVSGVDDFRGAFTDTVLGAWHWIKGPPIGPFYLTQVLTGTVTYSSPFGMVTDQNGVAGTLNTEATSTFSVNFTQQFVNFDIRATTGAGNWRGQGTSVGLEQSGQFHAFTGATEPHRNMTVSLGGVSAGTFGVVDGTFMGNAVDAVGMAFAFSQGTNRAAGTIGFTNPSPAPSQTAPYRVVLVAAGMTEAGAIPNNSEYNYLVAGGVNANSRVLFDTGTPDPSKVRRLDGSFPLPQPTGCTTGCTGVSEIPAFFQPESFGNPPPQGGVSAGIVNSNIDPTTLHTWGRYNSAMQVNDRVDGTVINPEVDLRTNNLHYIVSASQTGPTVLPTTGTATYLMVGGTTPTANGAPGATTPLTGTLGSATLSANFLAKTVDVGLNISGNVGTWAANASGVPIQRGMFFDARSGGTPNLNVTSSVAGATAGRIIGAFTGTTGQNAMMGYSLNAGGNVATNAAARTVSGVVSFQKQ